MSSVTSEEFPLAAASTLVQQVHSELKQRIIDGRLEPGVYVRDSVVATQMGVSRAPVRDACNLLVQAGLLTKELNHPYRVRRFTDRDMGELQLIRWGYEAAAVRHLVLAKITPTGTEDAIEKMVEAADRNDSRLSGAADLEFHLALVRSTGLQQLASRHESLMQQMTLSRQSYSLFTVLTMEHQHRTMLSALAEAQSAQSPSQIMLVVNDHIFKRVEPL